MDGPDMYLHSILGVSIGKNLEVSGNVVPLMDWGKKDAVPVKSILTACRSLSLCFYAFASIYRRHIVFGPSVGPFVCPQKLLLWPYVSIGKTTDPEYLGSVVTLRTFIFQKKKVSQTQLVFCYIYSEYLLMWMIFT